jgi:hypothetical protein
LRKLRDDACDELPCVTNISTTSGEEEAGPKTLLIEVFVGDSARNRRLSCPG